MPVHDWTRADGALFHAFHQHWICALCDALNGGLLPSDYYALVELPTRRDEGELSGQLTEDEQLVRKADRVGVHHRQGKLIAAIEIVSPGNKSRRRELRTFAERNADLIRTGIHLLVIDLFPPGRYDPQGIHKVIWDEFEEAEFTLPADKRLMLAAYAAGSTKEAYIDSVAVGDKLPDMPLFLEADRYVPVPLEATYQKSWAVFPAAVKGLLEGPPGGPPSAP